MPFMMDIESLLNEESSSRSRTDPSPSQAPLKPERSADSQLQDPSAVAVSPNSIAFTSPIAAPGLPDSRFDLSQAERRDSSDMSVMITSQMEGDTPNKNLPCQSCDKRFARRSDLVRHGKCLIRYIDFHDQLTRRRAHPYWCSTSCLSVP